MCLNYNVKLTESLADQLMGSANGSVNNRLLEQLGEAAQRQGDYQLAAKKFTQAGDKVGPFFYQLFFKAVTIWTKRIPSKVPGNEGAFEIG